MTQHKMLEQQEPWIRELILRNMDESGKSLIAFYRHMRRTEHFFSELVKLCEFEEIERSTPPDPAIVSGGASTRLQDYYSMREQFPTDVQKGYLVFSMYAWNFGLYSELFRKRTLNQIRAESAQENQEQASA